MVASFQDLGAFLQGKVLPTVMQNLLANALTFNADTKNAWISPMPVNSVWADNYISEVGLYQKNAFNIFLEEAVTLWKEGLLLPLEEHDYPIGWYTNNIHSVLAGTPCSPGFPQSYEYSQMLDPTTCVDPAMIYPPGAVYWQTVPFSDSLSLMLEPVPPVVKFIGVEDWQSWGVSHFSTHSSCGRSGCSYQRWRTVACFPGIAGLEFC
jgi:hypothetical protein